MNMRWLCGLFLLPLVLAGEAIGDEPLPLRAALGEQAFERCGLEKLADEELALLGHYLAPPPLESFAAESALRHLEREGWRHLTLYPGYRADPRFSLSDIRHLAFAPPDVLLLETAGGGREALPPGSYLAKVNAFSVELLDLYGEKRRYDIEERY